MMHGVYIYIYIYIYISLHDVNAYARFGFEFGDGVHMWMADYTPTGFCMHVVSRTHSICRILSSLQISSSSFVCLRLGLKQQ
jgi:hypothetical protein